MAKRKRSHGKQRRSKRRKSTKGRKRRSRLYSMAAPSGVATNRVVSMVYTAYKELTSDAFGSFESAEFRANGCHDPDVAVGGDQPMGWDQMKGFYDHYVVIGSKCTVVLAPLGGLPVFGGVYLYDASSTPVESWQRVVEARKGSYMYFVTNRSSKYVTSKYAPKKFFNVKDIKDNADRLGSQVDADPVEQARYKVWMQPATARAETVYAHVRLEYIVLFSEPKSLSRS